MDDTCRARGVDRHHTTQTIYHSIIKFSLMAFSDFVSGEILSCSVAASLAGLEIEDF